MPLENRIVIAFDREGTEASEGHRATVGEQVLFCLTGSVVIYL